MAKSFAPHPSQVPTTGGGGAAGKAVEHPLMAVQGAGGGGNQAVQQMIQGRAPSGPTMTMFTRIVGASSPEQALGRAFDQGMLRAFLETELQHAEDRFFTGKVLDGTAEALINKLDKDGSGTVGWAEFQSFEKESLATLAPGAGPESSDEQVRAAAASRFSDLDKTRDGQLSYDEIQGRTKKELPKDTENRDIVAELAARMALYGMDSDQKDAKVKDRSLSRQEWGDAASALAAEQRRPR